MGNLEDAEGRKRRGERVAPTSLASRPDTRQGKSKRDHVGLARGQSRRPWVSQR